MVNMIYKYLHLANYKDIPNWSVQYADEEDLGFTKKYPMARIGAFLVKSKDIIEVEDDVEYKQVTIKINNGGVVPRNNGEAILGSKIGTKRQHVVHAGQFIMSKIDARNGAYGIVPAELEGAIVTNDFPVFDVDTEKIIPQFLVLVSTTEKFVEFARKCSSGTTNRKRIDIDAFLNQLIPLPSIEEQKLILDDYNRHIESAIRKQYKIESLAFDSQKLICNTLGIKQKVSQKSESLLQFIHLTDTGSRWDALVDTYAIESKYRIENLGKFIMHISTGTTPPTSHPEYFDGDVKFFTPADLGSNKYLDHSSRTITKIAVDDKKARVYHKGDILFVGIGSTVGKVGIVKDEMVSSNQQITGFTIDSSKINPEYVYYYLLYNRDITTADQSKTTLPIVNQDKICKIPIVVPPIKVQDEIVSSLDEMYLEAKRDEKEITVLERKAISSFEHKIFD
jgi:restriction endonuclease S subunit